jgi:hypothetical protein
MHAQTRHTYTAQVEVGSIVTATLSRPYFLQTGNNVANNRKKPETMWGKKEISEWREKKK